MPRLGRILEYLLVLVKRRCHSLGAKKGFVKGEVLRLLSINSSRFTFNKNIQLFKIRLNNKTYWNEIFEKNISEFDLTRRKRSLKNFHEIRLAIDCKCHSSAERSLLFEFSPKCCVAQPRKTRCLFYFLLPRLLELIYWSWASHIINSPIFCCKVCFSCQQQRQLRDKPERWAHKISSLSSSHCLEYRLISARLFWQTPTY